MISVDGVGVVILSFEIHFSQRPTWWSPKQWVRILRIPFAMIVIVIHSNRSPEVRTSTPTGTTPRIRPQSANSSGGRCSVGCPGSRARVVLEQRRPRGNPNLRLLTGTIVLPCDHYGCLPRGRGVRSLRLFAVILIGLTCPAVTVVTVMLTGSYQGP